MSTPVLIDADPGNDDAVLLALAAAADDLNIVGVTTVAGNVELEYTTQNTRAILDWFGKEDVPVTPGAAAPLVCELDTASDIHGFDGLHSHPPETASNPTSIVGANAIVEQVRANPGKLTLLAIGPLTNVALALALEPDLPKLLDDLYVMGGAAFVAGNATSTAEFNFHVDPEAAYRVVREANPKLVGLDVTNHATVSFDTIREWSQEDEPLRTVASWLAYAAPEDIDSTLEDNESTYASHDAVVGVDLITNILKFETYPAEVETCGSCRGALICDNRDNSEGDSNVEVAVNINTTKFREELLGAIRTLDVPS